jgi:hypothetical protein
VRGATVMGPASENLHKRRHKTFGLKRKGPPYEAALLDSEFFDRASGYLCWVMDAGLRDLDYFLRDHFR